MATSGLIILIPAYDDWKVLKLLLRNIDEELAAAGVSAAIMVVDDASLEERPQELFSLYRALSPLRILRLKANLGPQRAIAIGLAYLHSHLPCDKVIIMDADGEDRPEDILTLLATSADERDQRVIFAERAARSNTLLFRLFYTLYRLLFRILTGRRIRFGNFSLIPSAFLSRIVAIADFWNNYPAAMVKARLPIKTVACNRGSRILGESRMGGLVSLIVHGLSAISVYNEVFGARALIASVGVMIIALALGITAAVVRLATDLAIPGWATYAVGLSLLALLQAVSLTVFFIFLILHGRNTTAFVPGRDYTYFVAEVIEHAGRETI
jgi:glycosyltransferase involved in cell wall biosynthesis